MGTAMGKTSLNQFHLEYAIIPRSIFHVEIITSQTHLDEEGQSSMVGVVTIQHPSSFTMIHSK